MKHDIASICGHLSYLLPLLYLVATMKGTHAMILRVEPMIKHSLFVLKMFGTHCNCKINLHFSRIPVGFFQNWLWNGGLARWPMYPYNDKAVENNSIIRQVTQVLIRWWIIELIVVCIMNYLQLMFTTQEFCGRGQQSQVALKPV